MRLVIQAGLVAAVTVALALTVGQIGGHRPAGVVPGGAAVDLAVFDETDVQVALIDPQPLDRMVVLSGHSLTDPLPYPLERLVRAAGGPTWTIHRSTIPGSPMDWRWNHPGEPVDARERIADYDVLVITERVSLAGTRPWHDSDAWALRWAGHAWENGAGGAGAEALLYATWVAFERDPPADSNDPDSGRPWRERLDREYADWLAILAYVNANRPDGAPEMRMIPANRVMAAVYDAIAGGQAPAGLPEIGVLFSDDIHLSEMGADLVALTHFAVLYGRDLQGLPRPGEVPAETWRWMKRLVAEVVSADPATGVRVTAAP